MRPVPCPARDVIVIHDPQLVRSLVPADFARPIPACNLPCVWYIFDSPCFQRGCSPAPGGYGDSTCTGWAIDAMPPGSRPRPRPAMGRARLPCLQGPESYRPGKVASRPGQNAWRARQTSLRPQALPQRGRSAALRAQGPTGQHPGFSLHARPGAPRGHKLCCLARNPRRPGPGAFCLAPEASMPCAWLGAACGHGFRRRASGFLASRCARPATLAMR